MPLLIVLPAALLVAAESPRAAPPKLAGIIPALEAEVLEARRTQDGATLGRLLDESYLEISGAGRLTKAEVLRSLADLHLTGYDIGDSQLLTLTPDAAALTSRRALRGTFQGKALPAGPAYITSVWARRAGGWRLMLTQGTPAVVGLTSSGTGGDFETELTASGVRYVYRGVGGLEDVRGTITVQLSDGPKFSFERYWGSWQPGEVKEVALSLAGVSPPERMDFSATAVRGGKPFSGSLVWRR